MGNSVSTVLKSIEGQHEETEALLRDSLTPLQCLAEAQLKLFTHKIKKENDLTDATSRKFLAEGALVLCNPCIEPAKIAKFIEEHFSPLADDDFAIGIGSSLGIVMGALCKDKSRNPKYLREYYLVIGRLGRPFRVDIQLSSYRFQSEAIARTVQTVISVSVVVSSIELARLQQRTIGGLVQSCYWGASKETQHNIYKSLVLFRAMPATAQHTNSSNSDIRMLVQTKTRELGFEEEACQVSVD